MEIHAILVLTILIGCFAALYSSVGHAGASSYLAIMALFGLSPEMMKPAALSLNILVAGISLVKFYQAGYFSWSLFWRFSITSVPFAYAGGLITLPGEFYKPVIGLVLLYAAWRIYRRSKYSLYSELNKPDSIVLMASGAVVGFLSGLIGIGGGIFLSPLLVHKKWADIKTVSGIAAAFILVNSISGLAGVMLLNPQMPGAIFLWAVAAATGAVIGSGYGSRRLDYSGVRYALAGVLIVAGMKMIILV